MDSRSLTHSWHLEHPKVGACLLAHPTRLRCRNVTGGHCQIVSELLGAHASSLGYISITACGYTHFGCFRKKNMSTSYCFQHTFCKAALGGRVGKAGSQGTHSDVTPASSGVKVRRISGSNNGDFAKALAALLPYVVVATAVSALVQPSTFTWVSKDYYAPALGGIMLSIGVQLSVKDFSLVLKRPKSVLIGYVAQYVFKPVLGILVAKLFGVPAAFVSGFLLMTCVAGAQLSSYASYLSDGDVALSIVLTSLSTITSAFVTPLLTWLLMGSVVPVDGLAMARSILQIVLCPVMLGLGLNTYAKPVVDVIRPVMPLMAMMCTAMCIGSPLALNKGQVVSLQGLHLLVPVVVFHVAAFIFGYWITKMPALRLDEKSSRSVSLCTGMQSSTLAGLLATQFLGGSQAVPPACSVVVMAVLGLSLASFWGNGNSISKLFRMLEGMNLPSNFHAQRCT